jgi:hypothetical protein
MIRRNKYAIEILVLSPVLAVSIVSYAQSQAATETARNQSGTEAWSRIDASAPAPTTNAVASPTATGASSRSPDTTSLDSPNPSVPTTNAAPTTQPTQLQGNFFNRLVQAYANDWAGKNDNGPEPARRGWPAPVNSPPYPFADWPTGGTQTIGAPDTTVYPLMEAINGATSRTKVYGWIDPGFNISTSNKSKFANAPAAYYIAPNSVQLDQAALYVERLADTVQKDHFDWGFRVASIYGLDYRFTTANGYFSHQLLGGQHNGQGNFYGADPVMMYVDLYFPHAAEGMDVRIGRYISLPDIEAQLAPNNYTYSHSLVYTYDCYTQTGVNATVKLSNHWLVQAGLSGGCEASPWSHVAKLTGNACAAYTWNTNGDQIYVCANSLNDGKYSYNNLAAYYATWYHKFDKSSWHTATESWYQYESHTPNVNPGFAPGSAQFPNGSSGFNAGAPLLLTNANGAWCDSPAQVTCFAPEWSIVNYLEKQIGKKGKDNLSIRNEYFDDIKGQRTGTKTRYSEHAIGWTHWAGNTVTIRPELRYEHSYDRPAYDAPCFGCAGTKQNQLVFASDMIFHF